MENVNKLIERMNRKMIETHPGVFRVGQIVEAQLCFKAVPFKKNFVKLVLQFKSLALLDDKLIEVCIKQHLKKKRLINKLTGLKETTFDRKNNSSRRSD